MSRVPFYQDYLSSRWHGWIGKWFRIADCLACVTHQHQKGNKKTALSIPYLIIHSKSTFADQQVLKLQEAPDMVPVGELPRHMLLSADRHLTGKVVPGSRVIASGIYSQFQGSKNVRQIFTS